MLNQTKKCYLRYLWDHHFHFPLPRPQLAAVLVFQLPTFVAPHSPFACRASLRPTCIYNAHLQTNLQLQGIQPVHQISNEVMNVKIKNHKQVEDN